VGATRSCAPRSIPRPHRGPAVGAASRRRGARAGVTFRDPVRGGRGPPGS
jgi:hypothetical protein